MADPQRLPVKHLVLHHAVTPLWSDRSKAWLANWFSSNGFQRAYGSNPANWSGLINPYTGQRSYSQAQYAGQRVTAATPDATAAERAAGYRLVLLVRDPFGQICWHAGNWQINRGSIGIENLGDYRNYTLRDGDVRVIADFWRPQDARMNGDTRVWGHNEVSQTPTACPARIMEQRNKVVEYINNPPGGNKVTDEQKLKSEPIFDVRWYRNRYPDLERNGVNTNAKATAHWLRNGIREGRQSTASFNVREYIANYGDLRRVFGENYRNAALHYFNFGIREGRRGVKSTPTVVADRTKELISKIQDVINNFK